MFRVLVVLALTALITLAGVACGGDDSADATTNSSTSSDSSASEVQSPAATSAGDANQNSGAGSGAATLTIGGESWDFTGIYCASGPEQTQNKRVSFSSGAFGQIDGKRVQLDASIQDTQEQGRYEGDGVIYSVSLNDVQDFQNPSIGWSSISGLAGGSTTTFQINDKKVSVKTMFDNELTDQLENVDGTLEMTCP